MKRKIWLAVVIILFANFLAVADEEELKKSIGNFAENANSKGDGSGYIGFYENPFSVDTFMLTGNFSLIAPWGAEIGGGWSTTKKVVALEVDVLNFVWFIPLGEYFKLGLGAGCPLITTVLANSDDGGESTGISPHLDLQFHFFANSDYGILLFARPGYFIDFTGGESGFSCPLGIGIRMPSSFIADAIAGAM